MLNVTPSAISHLLRELEQSLALSLFVTRGPNARLTETGERLGRRLIAAFDAIDTRPETSVFPRCLVFSPFGWFPA